MPMPYQTPTTSRPTLKIARADAKVLPMTKNSGSAEMLTPELALALLGDMPTYDASALTGKGGQARIVLGDQIYTLRITRAGKLILTK